MDVERKELREEKEGLTEEKEGLREELQTIMAKYHAMVYDYTVSCLRGEFDAFHPYYIVTTYSLR